MFEVRALLKGNANRVVFDCVLDVYQYQPRFGTGPQHYNKGDHTRYPTTTHFESIACSCTNITGEEEGQLLTENQIGGGNDKKRRPMAPPKKEDLDRPLKFFTKPPVSAPSPPLRKGEVYCLSSFAGRAEQWYKEEARRQLTQLSREAVAVGQRRQPSRAAKGNLKAGDYILPVDEVNSLLASSASKNEPETKAYETCLLTPPDGKDEDEGEQRPEPEDEAPSPKASLKHFRKRLGRAIHAKGQELRARNIEHGIRHTCTVGSRAWDCVDEEYCGHGLVDRCVRWVPKKQAHLRARMRLEMEGFFASGTENNNPKQLAELKKARGAALKAETLRRLGELEAALQAAPAEEAEMLESPTLGRWPASAEGFLREDVGAQRVELAGLAFAVDMCLGEPRVLML